MIKVRILTPESSESLTADAVFLPGALGQFEVLGGHAPIVSALVDGDVICRVAGTEKRIPVRGGIVRHADDEMTICTGPCVY